MPTFQDYFVLGNSVDLSPNKQLEPQHSTFTATGWHDVKPPKKAHRGGRRKSQPWDNSTSSFSVSPTQFAPSSSSSMLRSHTLGPLTPTAPLPLRPPEMLYSTVIWNAGPARPRSITPWPVFEGSDEMIQALPPASSHYIPHVHFSQRYNSFPDADYNMSSAPPAASTASWSPETTYNSYPVLSTPFQFNKTKAVSPSNATPVHLLDGDENKYQDDTEAISKQRKAPVRKPDAIQAALATLRNSRVSPMDFLTAVLSTDTRVPLVTVQANMIRGLLSFCQNQRAFADIGVGAVGEELLS
ncbi:hypothetical protein DXG01_016341 [Tephrocybe rancida]|nr:hypothetical protein DXG01_016341 [Tephrocybe rancida]